jgi:hypothetical protein
MDLSTQEKTAHWRNAILHDPGIPRSCLNHPTIKVPPWAMVPVGFIDAPAYSIDYSQDGANSPLPESPKTKGRSLKPVVTQFANSCSYPPSRGRPRKVPTEAAKRGRPSQSPDASGRTDERPDSNAGRLKCYCPGEAIPEKVRLWDGSLTTPSTCWRRSYPNSALRFARVFTCTRPSSHPSHIRQSHDRSSP